MLIDNVNMKKVTIALRAIAPLVVVLASLSGSSKVIASQEKFELLLNAIESENLPEFTKLLDDGLDPNYIGDGFLASQWINCLAARKRSDKWLQIIKKYNGNLNYTRQELLSHMGQSRYANALVCSVINGSTEPFRYLVTNGAEINDVVCSLCKQEIGKRSLLEFVVSSLQFNKSAWLLENYPEVKRQIDDKVIWHLEFQPTLREDRAEGFWKTIDLIRANSHTVNPKVKR